MIIHIKQKSIKRLGNIVFTAIDDLLFSRIISNSQSRFNQTRRLEAIANISFELNGKILLLQPEILKTPEDYYFLSLFAMEDINWTNDSQIQQNIFLKFLPAEFYQKENERIKPVLKNSKRSMNGKENNFNSDYLSRLENGKIALENELNSTLPQLEELQSITQEFYTLQSLETNLKRLSEDLSIHKKQIKQVEEKLVFNKNQYEQLDNSEKQLSELIAEQQNMKNDFQSLASKEGFAKSQMLELDSELGSTNEQGLDYIQKLESIEKKIFFCDQKLSQREETLIPENVVKRVEELNNIIRQNAPQLEKLKFLAKQVSDLELSLKDLKTEQAEITQTVDQSEEIGRTNNEISDMNSSMARLNGREESYIEGSKLLADNICPILGRTCTTIDEPVEEFFDKKLSALVVERSDVTQRLEFLNKQLSTLEQNQLQYRKWQTLQTKIYNTLDILGDSITDFQVEEEKYLNIPLGEKAMAINELLSGIIPEQLRSFLQKSFIELGTDNRESDLSKRMEIYELRNKRFEESWNGVFGKFSAILKEVKQEIDEIKAENEHLIQEKEQMRKEYGLICRQVESIEKRRKELSKILFEAGKTSQMETQIEELQKQIDKRKIEVEKFNKVRRTIENLESKYDFMNENLKEMVKTEEKYSGEYKILKHRLAKMDQQQVTQELSLLKEKTESLQAELERLKNRIYKSKSQLARDEQDKQTSGGDLFSNQDFSNDKVPSQKKSEDYILKLLSRINKISALQMAEYKRRYAKEIPQVSQIIMEKVVRTHLLLKETFWKDLPPVAIASSAEEILWWKERISGKENLLLIIPKKLEYTASLFESR